MSEARRGELKAQPAPGDHTRAARAGSSDGEAAVKYELPESANGVD